MVPQSASDACAVVGKIRVSDTQFDVVMLEDADVEAGEELARFRLGDAWCVVLAPKPRLAQPAQVALTDLLTERELQIAMQVTLGRLNKQIAADLHISEWTVSTHLRRVFVKLNVRSRTELAFQCSSMLRRTSELSAY
jgi:DNA-binding CsgD family transcriptional regulator